MGKILTIIILILFAGAIVVGLAGCIPADEAAARRAQEQAAAARADADRVRAEAEAYQQRQQADTAAAAERERIRQAAIDASTARLAAMLPYVLITGGVVLAVTAVVAFVWYQMRHRPPAADPNALLLAYVVEQQRLLQTGHRELWHALSVAQRQQAIGPGVIIYRDRD